MTSLASTGIGGGGSPGLATRKTAACNCGEYDPSPTKPTASIREPTATAVSCGVRNRQEQRAMEAQQAQAAPAPPPERAAVAAPAAGVDITGELTKLAEMRNNGILTDEEFAAAKAKVLG